MRSSELFPTAMTIYRYILGIAQPRLILIEFMTGKIVFFVVVFSMMIFITLFQSGMFSLLSSMVRYEDIDTLREIEESDLMVQSNNIESEMQFLGDDLEFDWIKMRLTDSYEFKCPRVSCFLNPIGDGPYVAKVTANSNTTIQSKGEIDKILKSHAFLIRMTTLHTELRDLLYFNPATENKYEFHIVRERLMSYPLMYLMIRNAFYNEALNDMLFRVFESGTDNTLYEDYTTGGDFQRFEESENNQARPFTLTDFRLAFVSLVLGWVLSGFCFALELLWRF
ncbi:unnamed protein product [Bemisia tabaci]|uniref:Uncharacterized protein n=1 Tax=Bemisia tabaci TaxID=7038 RepID=A0A9P0F5G8_BEMTA|nr:unnamed protein product [Bemisia tabaci]